MKKIKYQDRCTQKLLKFLLLFEVEHLGHLSVYTNLQCRQEDKLRRVLLTQL